VNSTLGSLERRREKQAPRRKMRVQQQAPLALWLSGSPETFRSQSPAYPRGCGYQTQPQYPAQYPSEYPAMSALDNNTNDDHSDAEDEPYYIHRCPFSNCQHRQHFNLPDSPNTSPHYINNIPSASECSNGTNKTLRQVKTCNNHLSQNSHIQDKLRTNYKQTSSASHGDVNDIYLTRCSLSTNQISNDQLSNKCAFEQRTNQAANTPQHLNNCFNILTREANQDSAPTSLKKSNNDISTAYRHCAIRFIMQRLVGVAWLSRSGQVAEVRRAVLALERAVFRRAASKEQYIREMAVKVVSILEEMAGRGLQHQQKQQEQQVSNS